MTPLETIVTAEPGTRVVAVDEAILWTEGRSGCLWREAPLCDCEICNEPILVNGDFEEGWWVQAAKITLETTAVESLCDILGDAVETLRRICPDCLADARRVHLRDRLEAAEAATRAIPVTDATVSARARMLNDLDELAVRTRRAS